MRFFGKLLTLAGVAALSVAGTCAQTLVLIETSLTTVTNTSASLNAVVEDINAGNILKEGAVRSLFFPSPHTGADQLHATDILENG